MAGTQSTTDVLCVVCPVPQCAIRATARPTPQSLERRNGIERFVRNFYRMHLSGFTINREFLYWHDELQCAFVPTMKTDISISQMAAPYRRIIVDTKYSVHTLSLNFGVQKFKSEDLYQMYAYLRTQEHVSSPHQIAEGILLYPTTSYDVDST